jgi:hypothetical protein
MSDKPYEALSRAARRAGQQPFFLAYVFHQYREANTLDEPALANLLGCSVDALPRLALCRRPMGDTSAFRTDIDHLAERFRLNGEQLAAVVRQVDALEAIRSQMKETQASYGTLRAARDREEDGTSQPEAPHD